MREIDRVRHSTRRTLHPQWYANLVVGVFFLGAGLASAVAESPALPPSPETEALRDLVERIDGEGR